jgi:hypothetical protein
VEEMNIKERFARWFIEKYIPGAHLHANPKAKNERPNVKNMTREEYMSWRKRVHAAPDPRDFEDLAEFEHERDKWVMKMEAQREGDR